MTDMPGNLREEITIGPYRVQLLYMAFGYRVEVHQVVYGRWQLVKGPFAFMDLDVAKEMMDDWAEALRWRVERANVENEP